MEGHCLMRKLFPLYLKEGHEIEVRAREGRTEGERAEGLGLSKMK